MSGVRKLHARAQRHVSQMRYVRLDERLQLDEDALFAMHSLAATALEETACHSRAASQRETIGMMRARRRRNRFASRVVAG